MTEDERGRVAALAGTGDQALEARLLLEQERFGTLSTNALDHPGFPFGSVVPYALAADGSIVLLASTLAEHTRNFLADPRVSLFVRDTKAPKADPQTKARVTVLGRIEPGSSDQAAELFEKANPKSRSYLQMADFALYRLKVEAVRFIGGFGRMSWIEGRKIST